MTNREFILNRNINESNSFVELLQQMDPHYEDELNVIDNSIYYNTEEFKNTFRSVNGTLRILNLNCGGLSSKFNKLKIFLDNCNHAERPTSVITLQETHFTAFTEITMYELPDYTTVYDEARINTFGGVAIYVHNSFSFTRIDNHILKQNSDVYESMFIKLQNKCIIGNIYHQS